MRDPRLPGGRDDHLGLLRRDLAGLDLLVLCGASGSGKSTAIALLLDAHPACRDRPVTRIAGWPLPRHAGAPTQLVVVDELRQARDLLLLRRLLGAGHTVIAASHLPPWTHRLAAGTRRLRVLRTDADPAKIGRHLDARGCRWTAAALTRYCAAYGATYTDADLILEAAGGDDFDVAFARFQRHWRMRQAVGGVPG